MFKIIILQPESQINPLIIFLQHGSYPADVFRHAGSERISVSLICACFEKSMRDESYDLLKMFHVKHSGGVSELISYLSGKFFT